MAVTEQHRPLTFQEGVAFIIAGALAIVLPLIYSIERATVLAWLLIAVGVYKLAQLIVDHHRKDWLISALIGVIYLGIGVWLVAQPGMSWLMMAIALTCLFAVEAILFLIQSMYFQREGCHCWLYLVLAALISVAAAVLMWPAFTHRHLWILGLILGVQLASYGLAHVMIAFPFVSHGKKGKR